MKAFRYARWNVPVITNTQERQEELHKFEASLVYKVSSKSAVLYSEILHLKKKRKEIEVGVGVDLGECSCAIILFKKESTTKLAVSFRVCLHHNNQLLHCTPFLCFKSSVQLWKRSLFLNMKAVTFIYSSTAKASEKHIMLVCADESFEWR